VVHNFGCVPVGELCEHTLRADAEGQSNPCLQIALHPRIVHIPPPGIWHLQTDGDAAADSCVRNHHGLDGPELRRLATSRRANGETGAPALKILPHFGSLDDLMVFTAQHRLLADTELRGIMRVMCTAGEAIDTLVNRFDRRSGAAGLVLFGQHPLACGDTTRETWRLRQTF